MDEQDFTVKIVAIQLPCNAQNENIIAPNHAVSSTPKNIACISVQPFLWHCCRCRRLDSVITLLMFPFMLWPPTFPQVLLTGGGSGAVGAAEKPGQRGWLPQWDRGSSSAQLLMPCYPRAIHHGPLRGRYVLPPPPTPNASLNSSSLPAFLAVPCGSPPLLIAVRTALQCTQTSTRHPPSHPTTHHRSAKPV